MTSYDNIKSNRRLVVTGAAIGYGLLAATVILFAINIENGVPGAGWQIPAWILILATPPTIAMLSLDRRPSLLPAAAGAALVLTAVELFGGLFLPVHAIPAIIWVIAWRRRSPRTVEPGGASWKRPLLAAALFVPALVMYAHLDPVCTVTGADGVVSTSIDVGAETGWRLGMSAFSSSTGSSSDVQGSSTAQNSTVTERTCWNDSIQWWEGLAGLVVAAATLAGTWRWPRNDRLAAEASPAVHAGGR